MQNRAFGLEIDTLFGFKNAAKVAVKLENAVGAAYNKRGEGPPPTLRSLSLPVAPTHDVVKDFDNRKDVVG